MLADQLDYVVGVDTHRDEHVLAVVAAPAGGVVSRQAVAAERAGYRQALRFAERSAAGRRAWAIEGAGHYGVGLARFLAERGETVLEISRTPRAERRLRGKDDSLDAVRTGRAALAGEALALPRSGERREALRLLLVARRSAVDVRREALVQLRSVIVTAPDQLREELRGLALERCSSAAAICAARAPQAPTSSRHGLSCGAWPAGSKRRPRRPPSLRARSWPTSALSRHGCSRSRASARSSLRSCSSLGRIGDASAPKPLRAPGRRRPAPRLQRPDETAPAQSRRRPAAQPRPPHDRPAPPPARPATKNYIAKRIAEGKSRRDATRLLKRYLARHLYRLLQNQEPLLA
jgi:transposase